MISDIGTSDIQSGNCVANACQQKLAPMHSPGGCHKPVYRGERLRSSARKVGRHGRHGGVRPCVRQTVRAVGRS